MIQPPIRSGASSVGTSSTRSPGRISPGLITQQQAQLVAELGADAAEHVQRRAVAEVNSAVTWPQLDLRDGELHRVLTTGAPAAASALAGTAAEAVDLLTGAGRSLLRACYALNCVVYFMKDHPDVSGVHRGR
ncbi:hypothetical protein ACRAKI_24060 [Saccharothrix isguenensis]